MFKVLLKSLLLNIQIYQNKLFQIHLINFRNTLYYLRSKMTDFQ